MTEESSIIHGQCEIYIFKYLVSKIFYCEHTKVKPNYICWLNYLTDVVKKNILYFSLNNLYSKLLIHQIFIELLLYAIQYYECNKYSGEQNKISLSS